MEPIINVVENCFGSDRASCGISINIKPSTMRFCSNGIEFYKIWNVFYIVVQKYFASLTIFLEYWSKTQEEELLKF